MTKQDLKSTNPIIDWNPTPGYVLCKRLKREDVAALYNRASSSSLRLPDNVGKVSDSVAVGQIVATGDMLPADVIEWLDMLKKLGEQERPHYYTGYKPGDYVAHIPFVDALIEIDGVIYSVLPYSKIVSVRKGDNASEA